MLVFLSDLHLVDGTTGVHNVPVTAFEGFFEDLSRHAAKLKAIKKIKIVFLGDIFDLNRTTQWLNVPVSERPWGDLQNKSNEIEKHSNKIIDDIIMKNQAVFNLLKNPLKKLFELPIEPERIFIPGNHDRLCNYFPSLRAKVRTNLNILASDEPFSHVYEDSNYSVVARHGHEYDVYNFEGTNLFRDADYDQIPVGDPITTEIASGFPRAVTKRAEKFLKTEELNILRRNLEEIDNVRPYAALFDWLLYQLREEHSQEKKIKDTLKEGLEEVLNEFNNLEYLKRWYKRHDRWNIWSCDEADKLQRIIRMCTHLNIEFVEKFIKLYSKIFPSSEGLFADNSDKILIEKAKEFLSNTSDYLFYVLGHTHNPMQVPIRITSKGNEQVYLNTGTWRTRYIKAANGGFISIKSMTYTIIYSPEENKTQRFETWTGSLKELS